VKHVIDDINVHEIDRNLALIEHLTGKGRFPVKLYPSPEDHQDILPYTSSPCLTIAPASLWFTKQYPEEKWVSFIKKVDIKYRILLLGSKNDYELCNRIMEQAASQQVQNLAGKLTFLQTAALMKVAVMNYVNDSAPQHFASAVNAPVTVVFCSTVPEFGFGPLSDNSEIVQTDRKLDCRPCGLHGYARCPREHFDCAYSISEDKLLKRL
jgi:heptosyltransferase-2